MIKNFSGETEFSGMSTAGNSTITTNSGGKTAFFGMSTGGQARFITNAGGIFDISGLISGRMTAGSIEGAGNYFLGSKALTVGLNNRSTEVSGTIADGGSNGGKGGVLIKVGTGTLSLTGINTYTGGTIVNAGTLQLGNGTNTASLTGANGSSGFPGGAGTDAVSVDNSATFKVLTNASVSGGAGGDGAAADAVNGGSGGNGGSAVNFSAGGAGGKGGDSSFDIGGNGGNGGAAVTFSIGGSFTNTGTLTGGPGGDGGSGGIQGGNGGNGGTAVSFGTGGTFTNRGTISGGAGGSGTFDFNDPVGAGGSGGNGGSAVSFSAGGVFTNRGTLSGGTGGHGAFSSEGDGGSGGNGGGAVNFSTGGVFTNSGAISGGTGGDGSGGGILAGGGNGGNGGMAVSFGIGGSFTNTGTVSGGAGGSGNAGHGGGSGGDGGAAVSFSTGGFFTNRGTTSGGAGGQGSDASVSAGNGGNGGAAVSFSAGGFLANSGTLSGGNGGNGGVGFSDFGGNGGNGGAGVSFSAGGSLTNSGTISGGAGGEGGVGAEIGGVDGAGGYGVFFNGAAGTLINQRGGIINGGVTMGNFTNAVTLYTGSVVNGILNIGTSTAATLTLDGAGSELYSTAVTGATTFDGTLIKEGTGTWTLDESFTYTGGTIVNAGTLRLGDGTNATTLTGRNGNSGFPGGAGTDAVIVNHSATFKVLTNASVFGGAGGDGGDAAVNGGNGGNGGAAVRFSAGGILANAGALSGGVGGDGGSGGGQGGNGGNGGEAVSFGIGGTFTNTGTLSGGTGGSSTFDFNGDSNGGNGGNGGVAVSFRTGGSLTNSGIISGGAGGEGGGGIFGNFGGNGGNGGKAASFSVGGTFTNTGTLTGGAGGAGGEGGVLGPGGGSGGAGGNGGAAVGFSMGGSFTNRGTIFGGAGGDGGASGDLGQGGAGGNGGAAVSFSTGGTFTNTATVSGGDGGSGNSGHGGGNGGNGGAAVSFGTGGSFTNRGTISGGAGGEGGEAGVSGGRGGNGGAAASFSVGGSLANSGTISGGAGGDGGSAFNFGGNGGNGGVGVSFGAGGSLTNSGTISGGAGGEGGVEGFNGTKGANGTGGYAVFFSGAAGTLINQRGGIINGGVTMGNFTNAVTLYTGSVVNGILNIGTSTGATLTLDGAGAQLYSTAVTGATTFDGALIKTGTGTWKLDESFNYTGGTTINGGTLQLGNGGVTGSIVGNVKDNGSLIFNRSNNVTFNAIISGSGNLVQNGSGTTILGGTNTYSGGTIINNGTLLVNNSQALGLGNVVINGGVLGADPQPINVKGNYTQNAGGTLQLKVAGANPGQYDSLNVGRNAALGGTLKLISLGFQPNVGNVLTLVSTGGVVSSRFAHFTDPFVAGPGVNTVELVYERQSVLLKFLNLGLADPAVPLVIATTNFTSFAVNADQLPSASLLDAVQLDPKAAPLISFFNQESLANLPADFEKISPAGLTAFYEISFSNANIQRLNLEGRLDDLHYGSNGFSSNMKINGATVNLEDRGAADGKSSKGIVEPILQPRPENRWGVWVTGFGDFVSVDADANAEGYDFTTGGVSLGIDYRITDQLAIGVMGDYSHTWTSLQLGGKIKVDSGRGGVYATWFSHGLYLNGAIYGGGNNYDSSRTGLGGLATGSTSGAEFSAFISGGYDLHFGQLTVGPIAALQYTYTSVDGFSESGSLAPMQIQANSVDSLRSEVGFRIFYQWQVGKAVVEPSLKAAWEHEYKYSALPITAGFAGIPGPSSTFIGPTEGHDSAVVSAGVSILLTPAISTYVNYDGQLGRGNYDSNAVTGGVRISF